MEADMQSKGIIVGFLSLLIGTLWLALLIAQGPRLALVSEIVFGSGEPIWLRLSVLPSLVLGAAGAILLLPLLLGGIGAMLGVQASVKVLRLCSQVGLAASAAVVIVFGATLVSTFGGTGARLGYGATTELTGAANLLILHGALFWALTRYRTSPEPRTA
jgi:hypothetical protein